MICAAPCPIRTSTAIRGFSVLEYAKSTIAPAMRPYCFCLFQHIQPEEVDAIVKRIAGDVTSVYTESPQDGRLAENQAGAIRCGDNGIFKGVPVTEEQNALAELAALLYMFYPSDGKYILDGHRLVICQSNAGTEELADLCPGAEINPLGDWTRIEGWEKNGIRCSLPIYGRQRVYSRTT